MVTSHRNIAGVFLHLACAVTLAAQAGSISGTVIDATTKQPMQGVHVSMFALQTALDLSDLEPAVYGAMSRADGRFSIAGLPPESYIFLPARTGYVFVPGNSDSISAIGSILVKPGENKTDFILPMTPRAVITGRVTDEFGDPVPNAAVHGIAASPGAARAILDSASMNASTDDRGEFRLHGAPGKYLLSVQPSNSRRFSDGVREVRTDGSQPSVYSTTWYPSAQGKEHAVAIDAPAGHDVTGIEIRLSPHRSVSVSGSVTGMSEDNQRPMVRIWSVSQVTHQLIGDIRNAAAGKDGKFAFSGLPPGDYRVQAFRSAARNSLRSPIVDLHAESGETSGIQLALAPGDEINGVLEMPLPPSAVKRTVRLEPASEFEKTFGPNVTAPVNADGTFHLEGVFPGKYELHVDPLPDNAYVKTVRLDSTDFPDATLDLTRGVGSSKLKVSLSLDAATIVGAVVDDKGEPMQLPFFLVVLARGSDDRGENTLKRLAPDGTYSLTGIRPGKYRLYAFNPLLFGVDAENRITLFEKGEPVEIHAGDRITKNAKLLEDK